VPDEIRPQYVLDAPDANALFASEIVRANGASIASTINQLENAAMTDLYSEWALALPSYSDQVLPFNVTLAGANEYGAMCASKVLGIEILNEGSGISVDDAVTESQATFVARAIEPLQAVTSPLDQVSPSCLPQETRARAVPEASPVTLPPPCAGEMRERGRKREVFGRSTITYGTSCTVFGAKKAC
jgi:hypothetical protein